MGLNKYDSLNNLEIASYDWICRVRVQAIWKAMNRETNEMWGLNMLFIDDSNNRIHAYANAKYYEKFEEQVVEGNVYVVKNFKVKDFLGDETYRPVRNEKRIYFTKDTKLTNDTNDGLKIDHYAFDLFHMLEIEKLANDNRFLIDMVGVMKNRRPIVRDIKNDQDKYRLKFDLVDGRHSVKVTLFDDFAVEIDKTLNETKSKDVIIIIACAKVTRYEGQAQLTNYPATRIYVQPDHYSVDMLQKKVAEMLEISSSDEEHEQQTLLSVMQIKDLETKDIEQEVICEVTVDKFENKKKWYSIYCSNCPYELKTEGGQMKCNHCKRVIPYPRRSFNLKMLCSDESGSMKILFPDTGVSRLTDKTVDDLYNPQKEAVGEQPIPDDLTKLLKQKYVLTILVKRENYQKKSSLYEATEIVRASESMGNFTPSKQETITDNQMEISKDGATSSNFNESPETRRSTNSKTKARKVNQPVPFDVTIKQEENEPNKKAK